MPTVLLTLEQVDDWREQLRQLTAQSADINKKIAELQKKLADAQPFITEVHTSTVEREINTADLEPRFPILKNASLPPTMYHVVRSVLTAHPSLEPKEIAKAIKGDANLPPRIKDSHPNYLYTALKRMTDRGWLVRDSQGRYSVPKTNEAAAE